MTLKITTPQMKHSTEWLKSIFELAGEKINELKYTPIEIIKPEEQKE